MPASESERARLGRQDGPALYEAELKRSQESRERAKTLHRQVPAEAMVWERSPQGLIKHMVNEALETSEPCLDMYQQYLEPGGKSGKHRHMSEEILFILEGTGYDLHWDPEFKCDVAFEWSWKEEPRKFEWKKGDFVYIPAWAIHQHFASGDGPARFISSTSRTVKQIGFDWLDQVESVEAPEIPS